MHDEPSSSEQLSVEYRARHAVDRISWHIRTISGIEGGPEGIANSAGPYVQGWMDAVTELTPDGLSATGARISSLLCNENPSEAEVVAFTRLLRQGGRGADSLLDTINADTWMYGDAGNDYLQQQSSIGQISGGAGNDTLYGLSSGAGDALSGGGGADCLWDATNTFYAFDCGNNTGDTRNSSNTGTTGCPNSDVCCGLC